MRFYGLITAVSWGVFTVLTLMCVCGICVSRFDLPDMVIYSGVNVSIGLGGYISGYVLGSNKRKQGIVSGLKSGGIMFLMVAAGGAAYMHGLSVGTLLRLLLVVCLPSVAGGIVGANRKNYKAPFGEKS